MNRDLDFLTDYFRRYEQALLRTDSFDDLCAAANCVKTLKASGGRMFIAGNGGSASIASHAALDFTKQAKVRAVSLSSDALVTAFANDYGYEHWLARAIDAYANAGDLLVLISSSGRSENILNAAAAATTRGLDLITFSGFDAENPLRGAGAVNFWVDSRAYNIVECTHQVWLLAVCDLVIGKAEYLAS